MKRLFLLTHRVLYAGLALLACGLLLAACGGSPGPDNEVGEVPTIAVLPSLTASFTPSPTPDVSATPTATPSITLTASRTLTSTVTPTITVTPSLTITNTATPTYTFTPVDTPAPSIFDELATLAVTFTPPPTVPVETLIAALTLTPPFGGGGTPGAPGVPTNAVPLPPAPGATQVSSCQTPPGGFGPIYLSDLTLQAQLGCPFGFPPAASTLAGAAQSFERGLMVWVANAAGTGGTIYVFNNSNGLRRLPDTFNPAVDPESGGEQPPPGLLEPVRGFGKVWRNTPGVRDQLGWATAAETGASVVLLAFDRGLMLDVSTRADVLILFITASGDSGTYRAAPGSY